MIGLRLQPAALRRMCERFGSRLQYGVPLARYTGARLGGPAEALLEVSTVDELCEAVQICWEEMYPYRILGGGSNVLISDTGLMGLVLVNRTRQTRFEGREGQPVLWAESGANFGLLARQAAARGLSGLEWAVSIPGTLGGAVVGNAGAHGGDMAGCLLVAEILHPGNKEQATKARREAWPVEKLEYAYRSSILKRRPGSGVVLSATLKLQDSQVEPVQAKLEELVAYRRRTQPPGASLGSMFKNPPGDSAGRLIEAAGLKGYRVGEAQISPLHANFFINLGDATAQDIAQLIQIARQRVVEKFGVQLELEIELLGEW